MKLLTKEIRKKLPLLYAQDQLKLIPVKKTRSFPFAEHLRTVWRAQANPPVFATQRTRSAHLLSASQSTKSIMPAEHTQPCKSGTSSSTISSARG